MLVIELPQGRVGPFGALSVFLLLGVLDKVLGVLVDAEVGQVHVAFLDVLGFGVVLVRGESGQALVQHVDPQGVVAGDQDVDPQVVLETVYQVRVVDVLGDEHVLLVLDLGLLVDHLDATAARLVGGFHDPESTFLGIFAYHLEPIKIRRKQVRDRHEVILLREATSLLIEMFPHVVLAPEIPAPGEVVDLLETFHRLNALEMGATDIEEHVPIRSALHAGEAVLL